MNVNTERKFSSPLAMLIMQLAPCKLIFLFTEDA